MNWKKEYDNDDRGGNWWDVTDGESSFRCMTEAEADFLLSKLQPAPVQQEPLGFMNAGNILEMQQESLPYAYVYPVKSTGVSVAVYTSPPAQRKPLTNEQWQEIAAITGCLRIEKRGRDAILRVFEEAAHGIKENT